MFTVNTERSYEDPVGKPLSRGGIQCVLDGDHKLAAGTLVMLGLAQRSLGDFRRSRFTEVSELVLSQAGLNRAKD